jgi:hypothetical protein
MVFVNKTGLHKSAGEAGTGYKQYVADEVAFEGANVPSVPTERHARGIPAGGWILPGDRVLGLGFEHASEANLGKWASTSRRDAGPVTAKKFVRHATKQESGGTAEQGGDPIVELVVSDNLRMPTAPVEGHVHSSVEFTHGSVSSVPVQRPNTELCFTFTTSAVSLTAAKRV